MVKTGKAFLQVRPSLAVGVGGVDTGLGLFTLHKIPRDRYVCAYAPTANLRESHLDGDYVIEMTFKDKILSVDGKQNPFELGLGIFCNDGSFPLSLAKAKFSKIIAQRVSCEFSKWDDEIWIRQHERWMLEKNYLSPTPMIRATGLPSSVQINSPRSQLLWLHVARLYKKMMIASGICRCKVSGE